MVADVYVSELMAFDREDVLKRKTAVWVDELKKLLSLVSCLESFVEVVDVEVRHLG